VSVRIYFEKKYKIFSIGKFTEEENKEQEKLFFYT
jgi:hypothetical protein